MKRCVIHIGMHKTGSTSIQNTFCKNLNNTKWKYADFNNCNHGAIFSTVFQNRPSRKQLNIDADRHRLPNERKRQKFIQKIIKQFDNESENILFSGEGLSSDSVNLDHMLDLRELIQPYVDNITIVGYVRTPKSYMESAFQERLKAAFPKLNFESLRPKYRQRLENFDLTFGKKNVQFWKFDPHSFINHCVVQDFCDRLGIEFPKENIKRKNESLSREAIAFLYTHRKYNNIQSKQNKKLFSDGRNSLLVNHLTQLKGSKFRFASEVVQPILDEHRADIQWMENRIGESLEEPYENSADAIRSEEDLLRYRFEDLLWLAEQLGKEYVEICHPKMTPKEVAAWMLELQLKLIKENADIDQDAVIATKVKDKSLNITMNLKELVQNTKQNTSELESLSDAEAISLLSNVFNQILQKAESLDAGELNVISLGRFQIKQIGKEKNGQKVVAKRVIFHADKNQKPISG